jgi:DNA processing protein
VFEAFAEESLAAVVKQSELAPWVALTRVKGLGAAGFKKLAARYADPARAFAASPAELRELEGLGKEAIEGILDFSAWKEVDEELRRVAGAGAAVLTFVDQNYPAQLREIADPPPLLYVKGELRASDKAVAIVGSRSASEYGGRVARDLAAGLSAFGFTVVSGMARGIDGSAHESALSAGGRTVAVLGCGVDRVYPPEHATLYRHIVAQGAVVSELPVGTRPMAFNFPARNRLISGLSLGVVVVEATEKSGSLITASMAAEQGREVFAVPGLAGSSRSRGAHKLLRQGAKLVETVNDIIEEIAPQLVGRASTPARRMLPENAPIEARQIFALLEEGALQIDELIEGSGLTPSKVSQILLELELHGVLRQLPGKRYAVEN